MHDFGHETHLGLNHLLSLHPAAQVYPGAFTKIRGDILCGDASRGPENHLAPVSNIVGKAEHRIRTPPVDTQRAANPDRLIPIHRDPGTEAIGLIRQRLHRHAVRGAAAVGGGFGQARECIDQSGWQREDGLDLKGSPITTTFRARMMAPTAACGTACPASSMKSQPMEPGAIPENWRATDAKVVDTSGTIMNRLSQPGAGSPSYLPSRNLEIAVKLVPKPPRGWLTSASQASWSRSAAHVSADLAPAILAWCQSPAI